MLYIFHVDTGTMMTFDMNLAMDSVANLQRVIAKACQIQEDKQVLLISGGESLDPLARVGSYSAGTAPTLARSFSSKNTVQEIPKFEKKVSQVCGLLFSPLKLYAREPLPNALDTNPIFLFSKSTIEAATPPSPSVHYGSDIDLQEQVEGSLIMPPTYETVVSRAQLALQFHEVDKDELRACEKLVHDQHLQQQGWAAVVANLEDITSALRHRSEIFHDAYSDYLSVREHFISLLGKIPDVLLLLSKIPVLHSLQCVTAHAVPEETESGEDLVPQTLFAWINSQDPQNRLEDMSNQCLKVTEQFDEKVSEILRGEVEQTFEAVANQSMKEVKGLEDRLYGLDQIMSGAKRLVQEQAEMSQGFVQNQNRAGNLRDNSVLPDLCASHKKQLLVMLSNHRKLREIKKKCRMAKEELSVNLHTRLRWVMFVEKKICDIDGKLMIHHENLKRLRKRLDILQQINDAPHVYAQLVVEVVRRKNFSTNFLQWASNLAEESSLIHSDEIKRREVFLMEVGQHFLHALFHGFEDIPPTFATEAPELFDQRLPDITSDDLEVLQKAVPELSTEFCLSKEISVDLEQRLSALGPKACPSHAASVNSSISPGRVNSKSRQLTPLCQSHNTCASDIDILQESVSDNHNFSPIECDEISFDGQICAPGTEAVIKKEPISPQDNLVFLMPESLSTKLTAEMKSQASLETAQRESTLSESGESSTLKVFSEGLPVEKSSDDSSSSRKIVISGTVTSDTSPEGETSQDFTTADFYIDESMPSSIEHMAASKSMEKSELSKQLQEKCEDVLKLEQEIRESQYKLTTSQTKMKTLQEFVEKEIEKLRMDLTSVKEGYSRDKTDFIQNFVSFSTNLTQVLSTYEANMTASHSEEMKNLQQTMESRSTELEGKVSSANQEIEKLEIELKQTKEGLDNTKADSEATRISLQTKINEISEAYEKEREEMIRGHALEMEVELDKVREELKQEVLQKEADLREKLEEISRLQDQVSQLKVAKEKLFEEMTQRFQAEKEELVAALENDFCKQKEIAVIDAVAEQSQEHEESLLKLKQEFDLKVQEMEQKVTEAKNAEFETKIVDLKAEWLQQKLKEMEEMKKDIKKEHEELLKRTEENLHSQHKKEMEERLSAVDGEKQVLTEELQALRNQPPSTNNTAAEGSVSREKHEQIVTDIQAQFEQMKALEVEEAVKQSRAELEKELTTLRRTLEHEYEDKMAALKASVTAEKQVLFNEAVSKVTTEKEKLIEELRGREATLLSQQQKDKELLDKLMSEKAAAMSEHQDSEEKIQLLRNKHHQLEDELAMSRQQLEIFRQQIHTMSSVSMISTTSEVSGMPGEDPMLKSSRYLELEGILRSKEEEITKLNQKVMELSMTASTRTLTQDKVSITSCSIGDIVLLCLDERHDQYVVFTIGTTLHFLHSDCLQPLGLKTNPGEARKSWVLAQIVEKEYCQAKKPQNRFRVPVGTKFYRVKAKPWTREPVRKPPQPGATADTNP